MMLTTGSISGTVFEDMNMDGVQGPDEAGLPDSIVVAAPVDNLQMKLTAPIPQPEAKFGFSLDVVNDQYIVVGAHQEGHSGLTDAGTVYVFDQDGALVQALVSPTPIADDRFGRGITVDGDSIIVGAGSDYQIFGSLHVFDLDSATGQWEWVSTLDNPVPGSDRFGQRLASSNGYVLTGAPAYDNADTVAAGRAYLFDTKDGALKWTFENPSPQPFEGFGDSVQLRQIQGGYQILIGTGSRDGPGEAYLYEDDEVNGVANLVHAFQNPNPDNGARFGQFANR